MTAYIFLFLQLPRLGMWRFKTLRTLEWQQFCILILDNYYRFKGRIW